jgi:hypothetical protein
MKTLARFITCPVAVWMAISLLTFFTLSRPGHASASDNKTGEKELYIPSGIRFVPDDNDFHDKESEFSFHRMAESDHVAIFWHREYGDDPMANPDESRRFDVHDALKECERYYNYYVNELKLVEKGNSISDKYKLLLIVFGGDVATAFGGGAEDKVGIMWTNATRINKPPYGVLAHEMAHSFQFYARIDNGGGPRGPIMEASAQYLLWQVLPEWMTFENYHLVDYMTATHYAFLHPRNMYNSPYFLEYWSQMHGKTLFGRILRETEEGEDPVMTYQRITGIDQETFNDEMFDAARRFITWDLTRVADVASQYANQHSTILNEAGDDWFRIDPSKCPQNYGYNGIRLEVPPAGTAVELEFKGIAGAEGFNAVNVDKAGWRYGFLASLAGGGRVYGAVFRDPEGKATFSVPEDTEYLWLVVSGAPKAHWPVVMRRNAAPDEGPEENWPYQIRLRGTSPHESVIQ